MGSESNTPRQALRAVVSLILVCWTGWTTIVLGGSDGSESDSDYIVDSPVCWCVW